MGRQSPEVGEHAGLLTVGHMANGGAAQQYQRLAGLLVGRVSTDAVGGEAEWRGLVALAAAERVAPLLHRALRALPEAPVPSNAAGALAAAYREAVHASLRYQGVRVRVCRRFRERAIPTLLWKGAALAFTCYEDPATRPMADIDLLLPQACLEAAARCVEEDGFAPLGGPLATAMRSPWGHLAYLHAPTGVSLELHWALAGLRRVQAEAQKAIWSGARPLGPNEGALAMRPGHTIPLLCAHMILRHQHARLLWLYDLHRVLLAANEAEGALARDAAVRWGLVPCTARALLRVRELFGTPLPSGLESWAAAAVARDSLAARMAAHAVEPGPAARPNSDLVELVLHRNWSMLRIFFPPPDALRAQRGLEPCRSLIPAYVALIGRRLRGGPPHFRRLWRSWRAVPPSQRQV